MSALPLVSAIVPTLNSVDFIAACLESICSQTYGNLEIIVVDNGSTDETRDIAARYADKVLVWGPERSAQVNYGVKKARGKYVYRVDSDFALPPGLIEEAVQVSEDGNCDAIIIHNTSDPSVGFWGKVRKLERDCYKGDTVNVAARFFLKSAFEQVGGFDETLIAAEDYDLHNRAIDQGLVVGYIESEEVHLGEPHSLAEIIQKHYYYGQSIGRYIQKNGHRAIKQLSPMKRSFMRHWRTFATHPILTGGFVVYQITRYTAAAAGYMWSRMADGMSQKAF